MNKISKDILAKIKSEKISPHEKWIFLAKNYGIWSLSIMGIILAGIFVGNAIHEVAMGEWDIMHRFPGGRPNFLFHAIPFLWLLGVTSAFALAFFLLRQTKRGYKYGILAISGVIFIASGICGVALLSTTLPPKFREFRMEHLPPNFDSQRWMNPSEGFLFGEILVIEDKLFLLDALDNSVWEVDITEARIPPRLNLTEGMKVRVIGEDLGENKFSADFVKSGNTHEVMMRGMFRKGVFKEMQEMRKKSPYSPAEAGSLPPLQKGDY
jgi:hypothetical protein